MAHLSQAAPERTRTDWNTPEVILRPVREAFGGEIDLDPCSNPGSVVGARENWILPAHNGLTDPWPPGARVFCNPPYGMRKGEGAFLARCAQHCAHPAGEAIALVAAKVDSVAWFDSVWRKADAICFWRGRVKFLGAKDTAKFPIALIYWGSVAPRFVEAFEDFGRVVFP